jgi:hypothetical protein
VNLYVSWRYLRVEGLYPACVALMAFGGLFCACQSLAMAPVYSMTAAGSLAWLLMVCRKKIFQALYRTSTST